MNLTTRSLVLSLVFVVIVVAFAPRSSATLTFVDTSVGGGQVGAYFGFYDPNTDDPPAGYPPTLPPDNDPNFQNYFMGRSTISGFTTPERRAFFLFDMSSISIPAGEFITDVSIDLELLAGGTSALANFTGGVEVVEFSSTTFSAAEILDPNGTGAPADMIFDSFGSGAPYGVFEVFDPNGPMPTLPDTYSIPLPGAIPDVEAAIGGGSIFVVTAKLATYDPGPIGPGAPPPIVPYEYVFGLTDVVSGSPLTAAPELTITTVPIPEPACISLLAIGLVCWSYSRRKL